MEYLEQNKLMISRADKDVECLELLHIADKSTEWYSYLIRNFGSLSYAFIIAPSNPTLRYLSKRNDNVGSQKKLYANIHNSFIYNCQRLEITQMSFSWWMDRQTVVYPHNRNYYAAIKNELLIPAPKWITLKCIFLSEISRSKGYILNDSLCMTFKKEKNYRDK